MWAGTSDRRNMLAHGLRAVGRARADRLPGPQVLLWISRGEPLEVYELGVLGSGRGSWKGGEEEPQADCVWELSEFRMACFQDLRSTVLV